MKNRSVFWNDAEIKRVAYDPHALYVAVRGGKGRIMAHGVFSGFDGQVAHWNLSGWMNIRKAHQTLNEYISEYFASHNPVSEV